MRLLPYLQACLERAAQDDLPIVRPLILADPTDQRLRTVEDAFLVGDDLLVVPALEPGTWRRLPVIELANDDEELIEMRERRIGGPDHEGTVHLAVPTGPAPCFQRVGSVIPLGPGGQPPADEWVVGSRDADRSADGLMPAASQGLYPASASVLLARS